MRLVEVVLRHAPGLGAPLRLVDLAPGLNVVLGPNASGKSTLRRAVHATLWPDASARYDLVATWAGEQGSLNLSLAHGRAEWSPARPPLPDAASAGAYVLTMDDLLRAGRADEAIARALRVELSGGYDLDAARSVFGGSSRPPRTLLQAVRQARLALHRAERESDALAAREEELASLRRLAADARSAATALLQVDRAEERLRLLERIEAAGRERALLPEGAGRVDGSELTRFDELAEREAEECQRAEQARRELNRIVRRLEELGDAPTPEDVEAWRHRLEAWRQVLNRLEHAERELSAAVATERELRSGVFGEHDATGPIDPAWLDAIEDLSERERGLTASVQAAEQGVRALEELLQALPEHTEPGTLERQAQLLRSWLATTELLREQPRESRVPTVLLLLAGLLALLVGLGLGLSLLTLAGALAWGLAAGLWWSRRSRGALTESRERLRSEVESSGEGPQSWEEGPVRSHLAAIERRLMDARLAGHVHSRLDTARNGARARQMEREALSAELTARIDALRVAPDLVRLPLAVQVRRIVGLMDARSRRAECEQRRADLEAQHQQRLTAFNGWLTLHGVAPCRDVAEAAARLDGVSRRLTELQQLREHEARTTRIAQEAEARAAQAASRRLALLEGVGLADREALSQAVSYRARFVELTEHIGAAERRVAELTPGAGEFVELDEEALTTRRIELEREAARYEERVEEIKGIEVAIRAAGDGRTLEEARAARTEAEAELLAARDHAWEQAVARWLADAVEGERREVHAPAVLGRAREWFTRFTRGAFALELRADGFGARDTRTGRPRSLGELSDATRIQLLLAARIAHVEALEAQSGTTLPLFLDEVLSTTDPERFREIARTLLELCASGRQLLYLTADPAEAAAWVAVSEELGYPPPRLYDLGDPESVRPPAPLPRAVPPPAPPAPDGHDAESYARRLGVHAPDGFLPPTAWHLWYLLPFDLQALHRCLLMGLTHVGRWTSVSRLGEAVPDPDVAALLRRRVRLLEELLERWRHGRARPLVWEDLLEADVVTPAFEEDLRRLLDEYATDPSALLQAVAALPRFRRARVEQLETFLRERELLTDEPPFAPEILEAELVVQATIAGETDAGWVRWLVHMVSSPADTSGAAEGGTPTEVLPSALT